MKRGPRKPPPIADALASGDGSLHGLRQMAAALLAAEASVSGILPESLSGRWKIAALEPRRVRFAVYGAHWATQLRFQQALIRDALRPHGLHADGRVEIRVTTPPAEPVQPIPASLSPSARDNLEATARNIGHPPLAAALRRLASRDRQD